MTLLSLKEAAQYLGLSPATLRKLVQNNKIPHYRLPSCEGGQSHPKFKVQDLDKWIECHRIEARPLWPKLKKVAG